MTGQWSRQARAAGPGRRRPAPRAPRSEELRSDHACGPTGGPGAVHPVVQPRSQAGGGLVQPVHPSSTYSRARKRTERSKTTGWTTWTAQTGSECHRVGQASRSRVSAQRPARSCPGASCLAARHRGSLLALRVRDRAGHALRRRSPGRGRRAQPVEPRARVRAMQPARWWSARCRAYQRAARPGRSRSCASGCWPAWRRGPRAVVRPGLFVGWCYPRLRLQQQLLPLNWRLS